jgi:hypothetical protein
MTTIYIVTEGSYSDYHICAVYDTKEAAEYHAKHLLGRWRNDAGVEEYELNPHRQTIADRLKPFMVEMGRDGTTYRVQHAAVDDVVGAKDCFSLSSGLYVERVHEASGCWLTNDEWRSLAEQLPVTGTFHVLAMDEQHAVKIANERRARVIAENGWPEGFPGLTDPWQTVPMELPNG